MICPSFLSLPFYRAFLSLVAVLTLATIEANATDFTLPVAFHGLRSWGALIGRVCQAHEESTMMACLDDYIRQTYSMLDSLVRCKHPCKPHTSAELAKCPLCHTAASPGLVYMSGQL